MPPRRILLYGVCGSGKTTLARRLADALELPFYSGDEHMWRPGWTLPDKGEQRRIGDDLTARDAWVIDSAYSAWRDLAEARSDLMVALDYPRHVSLWRLLRRSADRAWTGRPVCNGNVETWRKLLGGDSIVLWHFRTFAARRRYIRGHVASLPPGRRVILRHPRQAEALLARAAESSGRP